ncbi:hypothetical protein KIK06_13815 [Nocardiopsis sp. EMB25]|uniref:hypothetical protein n=1 Tax=Nocardiopsis sp. EMB25 TaxID=2835867 RepID=UPI0022835D4B|nr:hypothetical protein [Nocardiopsis sp. EMB25]MCY9784962.1 hypothetical protein [Nocardiopsis sp. EMB25]
MWRDPEVIVAVRERDAQAVVRFLRRRVSSLTQEALASMCRVAQSTITRAEAGRGLTDRRRAYQALEGLGAPGVGDNPELTTPQETPVPSPGHAPDRGFPRDLLTLQENLWRSTRSPQRARITHQADGVLAAIVSLDDQVGGGDLFLPLDRYLSQLSAAVDRDGSGMDTLGPLSQMVGWIAMDAGNHGAARRHLTTAIYAGHETGDTDLAASALSYWSLQDTYLNRPRQALALARTAVEIGAAASPLVTSTLHARLARAHAKLGNLSDARSSIERMHTAFDHARRAGESPVWVSYVDEVEVAAQTGATYLDLGLFDEAITALNSALTLLKERAPHRLRDQSHYLVRVARAHLALGDVETACAVATKAVELAETIRSPRVNDRIGEFRSEVLVWKVAEPAQRFLCRSQGLTTPQSSAGEPVS